MENKLDLAGAKTCGDCFRPQARKMTMISSASITITQDFCGILAGSSWSFHGFPEFLAGAAGSSLRKCCMSSALALKTCIQLGQLPAASAPVLDRFWQSSGANCDFYSESLHLALKQLN